MLDNDDVDVDEALRLQRAHEHIEEWLTVHEDQTAGRLAHMERMGQFFRERGDPVLQQHSRELVVVRCGQPDCGRKTATVYATADGPLYKALIRWRPTDADLPPRSRPDAVARELVLPRADPDLADLVESATEASSTSGNTPEKVEDIADLLLWTNPSGTTWHPPLLARCPHHPTLWRLDRSSVRQAAAQGRSGARAVKLTHEQIGRPVV